MLGKIKGQKLYGGKHKTKIDPKKKAQIYLAELLSLLLKKKLYI